MSDDPFIQSVGARLRAMRRARNLSQRALAARAGVTHATISMIEGGRTNPSLGALRRVLEGMQSSLAEFFAGGAEESHDQVFFGADELVEAGQGPLSLRMVGRGGPDRALQILLETYAPGSDTGRVMLSHEAEEGGIVLAGRAEVTVGEQMRTLGPGESYLFDSREPHRFRNPFDAECRVVSACTPPTF